MNQVYSLTSSKIIIDKLRDKGSATMEVPQECNIYKTLFIDAKKVDVHDLDRYKKQFEAYKSISSAIKKTVCVHCPERPMSSSEIGDIKLFKPQKAADEMKKAIMRFKESSDEFAKFAEGVAEWITKNIIEYVADNITVD